MQDYDMIIGFEPHNWTIGAVLCYKRGCNCQGCFINRTYRETLSGGRCCMKFVVRRLILRDGLPKNLSFDYDLLGD